MNQMESNLQAYDLLRSWYLARLRKLSLQTQRELQLTPGALISADRDNIERLILAGQATDTTGPLEKTSLVKELLAALVVAAIAAGAYIWVTHGHLAEASASEITCGVLLVVLVAEPFITSKM